MSYNTCYGLRQAIKRSFIRLFWEKTRSKLGVMEKLDSFKKSFGARIQELRKRQGLTQEGLAEAVGRSVDTISNIERGFSSTRLETAAELAKILGVTLPELFEFSEGAKDKTRSDRREIERLIKLLHQCPKDLLPGLGKLIEQAVMLAQK